MVKIDNSPLNTVSDRIKKTLGHSSDPGYATIGLTISAGGGAIVKSFLMFCYLLVGTITCDADPGYHVIKFSMPQYKMA